MTKGERKSDFIGWLIRRFGRFATASGSTGLALA
jgi:hypothetical protein